MAAGAAGGVDGSAGVVWATVGTVGAATVGAAAGIGATGASVSTTVGAAASAAARPLATDELDDLLPARFAGAVNEYEFRTTGVRICVVRPATRRATRRCVVPVVCRVTAVRRTRWAGAATRDPAGAAVLPPAAFGPAGTATPAFGMATCGKIAVGSVRAGSETARAVGDRSARMPAAKVATYGSASAIRPARPNQKRCRRVPNTPSPRGPVRPEPAAAYDGFNPNDKRLPRSTAQSRTGPARFEVPLPC